MKKKKILSLCAAVLLAFVMTACQGGASGSAEENAAGAESTAAVEESTAAGTESASSETAASGAAGVTGEDGAADETAAAEAETEAAWEAPAQDRAGNPITVPDEAERIISLAPAATQILCDLGLAEKIVAVDSNSPMYAEGLSEDVLQFNMMEPDLEQIMNAEADIVFVSNMSSQGGEDIFKSVRDAGVCVAEIPTSNSIADVEKDVQFVADCVGMSAEGSELVAGMEAVIGQVSAIGETITEPKTVLFEISPVPYLYSFGTGVYLNEMIELIGAKNVLADQEGWLSVTEESAVAANPDVILTSDNFSNEDPVAEILGREGWQNVTAVAEGQVAYIDNAASSLPNHHIVDALVEMAKAVYPDAYAELD